MFMEIKCKLCGGRLVFKDDCFSATCDSCGISQFIFDYLEKESNNYNEQVEVIRTEKKEFENLYKEYADDIVNADSYCLISKDLLKIINFFDKCGEYKDAPKLLLRAKKLFISTVSSTSDCGIAFKYLEEIDDLTFEEKERYNKKITEAVLFYTIAGLKEKGFLVLPSEEITSEGILSTIKNLLNISRKNQDSLTVIEKDIVSDSLEKCVEYIKSNTFTAIDSAQKKETLCEIRKHIPSLKKTFFQLQMWDIENALDVKIDELTEHERLVAEELDLKTKQENARNRKRKVCTFVVVIAVIFGLVALSLYQDRDFSPKNISINVLTKVNDTFNEELSNKHSESGYFYSFDFEVTNKGSEGVKLIRGDLEIVNKQGKVLSTSSLVMRLQLNANSSIRQNVQLNVKTSPSARELWSTDLEDLEISFRIREIHLINGPSKTYVDTKKIIIHEIET